ncbi:MAG: pyridoxamine 5'-phosphate oxidase family protein [Dysgonamonadaceae bacterium]|nr:pyridoxamine 5'-phosphate oxidase family protein [Dysgonamonadaceae bacterium]
MSEVKNQNESACVQEVYDFIKKCQTYYLATVEGDQPRVRPFGTINIFEGKLYIQTGKVKKVSKQMGINPKIEICAFDGQQQWIRVQAIVVEDDRREAKQSMLDAYPELQGMYSADDNNTQVLYLKDATATIASFSGEPKVINF